MPQNTRFQVRETDEELEKLDKALLKLGYINGKGEADRTGWYRECKRQLLEKMYEKKDEGT